MPKVAGAPPVPFPARHGARIVRDGWQVWLDEEGFLWTSDFDDQGARCAAGRVETLEGFLAEHDVLGVIVDDRIPGGRSSPEAVAIYRGFVKSHPELPIAVVTSAEDTFREAHEVRRDTRCDNLTIFRTLGVAQAWIRIRRSNRARGGKL